MKIFILPNAGIIVDKAKIQKIEESKDQFNRIIGLITFNSGQTLKIEVPDDYERYTSFEYEVENKEYLKFDYIKANIANSPVESSLSLPITVVSGKNILTRNDQDVLYWMASLILKTKE